jgi:hypothetical protein
MSNEPKCKSCGVAFADHDGLQSLCAKHQELVAERPAADIGKLQEIALAMARDTGWSDEEVDVVMNAACELGRLRKQIAAKENP